MTTDLLRQTATSRLPISFYRTEDIDQIRILRAAGLVVALIPAPSAPSSPLGNGLAAQVFTITQKGRQELAKFAYPRPHALSRHQRTPRPLVQRLTQLVACQRRPAEAQEPASTRMY